MGSWPEPFIAGVSLSYDGSAEDQLTVAIPQLSQSNIYGTFFAYPPELLLRLPLWRAAVAAGHEIGNGFVTGLVDKDGLIGDWTPEMVEEDLCEAEELLSPLAGDLHSICYPCVQTEWGKGGMPIVSQLVRDSIVKINRETLDPHTRRYRFVRSPLDGFNFPDSCNFQNLHCFVGDQLDADSLSVLTHIGISQGAWVIIAFGGIRDHVLREEEHRKFLMWLTRQREAVLVGPISEIGSVLGRTRGVESITK